MAFGHWMEVNEGDVRLRMGPIKREDMARFVAAEAGHGMQSYEVVRYLGYCMPPTVEGEKTWWDKASEDSDKVRWGIYVPEGDDGWKLVGNTALSINTTDRRRAESGCVIFDRSAWGQRIASTSHLGRTRYGFEELDLLAINSSAFTDNVGSNRALTGVGYVQTGSEYCRSVVAGQPIDTANYLMVNPADEAWRYFWRRPEAEIPDAFHAARERTRVALKRAATAVSFL